MQNIKQLKVKDLLYIVIEDKIDTAKNKSLALFNNYKRRIQYVGYVSMVLVAVAGFAAIILSTSKATMASSPNLEEDCPNVEIPNFVYGMIADSFYIEKDTFVSGRFFGEILAQHNISYQDIDAIAKNAKDVFPVTKFRVDKEYTVLSRDTAAHADYFIYEPNIYEYVIFDLNTQQVRIKQRPVQVKEMTATGTLESSLWNAMVDNGLSIELADKMEDVFQWSLDFHHLQKNDEFKLVYDQKYIEGKKAGVGEIKAAYYKTGEAEYHAIYFENEADSGFYDLNGHPMKTSFLKAPVKYARISSSYNLRRFHPVLKRTRPHYGTDYAAPYGTPIIAVGNGVVTKASRTKGNGNFVKIKHDDTYQTQYLHMQKFAAGIKPGAHVKQGQVIGYVGSTGLATGPHVCFRFWKNNKQVNHLALKFPPSKPLGEDMMPAFDSVKNIYLEQLDAIKAMPIKEEIIVEENTAEEQEVKDEKEIKPVTNASVL